MNRMKMKNGRISIMNGKKITIKEITFSWIDSNKPVIVIDGIAGAAKTSTIVRQLQKEGIDYIHTTSTNRLKKDVSLRFGEDAGTVASQLFRTQDMRFYDEERDIPQDYIIIDEILQTSTKVIQWIKNHYHGKHIIVCTDSQQMLSPVIGKKCLQELISLENEEFVSTYYMDYSYRPINDKTREIYNEAYFSDSDGFDLFQKLQKKIKKTDKIPEYNRQDGFICHTNKIEQTLYKKYKIAERDDIDLIPKGRISSQDVVHPEKYPVLCQMDADQMRTQNYLQCSNIGSVVRFQGTEIQPGNKLYFFMEKGQRPCNREIYTMITRAKNFDDIEIVYIKTFKDLPLTEYLGCPIIPGKLLTYEGDDTPTKDEVYRILSDKNREQNDIYYEGLITKDGTLLGQDDEKKPELSITNLLKTEPELRLANPNSFYRKYQEVFRSHEDMPETPTTIQTLRLGLIEPFDCGKTMQIDLYSSYPHCWKYGGVPDGRTYLPYYPENGRLGIYIITGGYDVGKRGQIITDPAAKYFREHYDIKTECIGSFELLKTDKIGEKLLKLAYKNKETKADLKTLRYGYLQRPFLYGIDFENGTYTKYVKSEKSLYILTIAHLQSTQAMIMEKIARAVEPCYPGVCAFKVDSVYCSRAPFYQRGDTVAEVADRIKKSIPDYDFRIIENKKTIFQTYEDLKTRDEMRLQKKREYEKKRRRGN